MTQQDAIVFTASITISPTIIERYFGVAKSEQVELPLTPVIYHFMSCVNSLVTSMKSQPKKESPEPAEGTNQPTKEEVPATLPTKKEASISTKEEVPTTLPRKKEASISTNESEVKKEVPAPLPTKKEALANDSTKKSEGIKITIGQQVYQEDEEAKTINIVNIADMLKLFNQIVTKSEKTG